MKSSIGTSQAKGIRRAFLESLDNSIEKFNKLRKKDFLRQPNLHISKKTFDRNVDKFRSFVEDSGLIQCELTLKQGNNYLWACLFLKREKIDQEIDAQGMTPTGFARINALTLLHPAAIRMLPMNIRISAHAIDRVIQRLGLVDLPIKKEDIQAINVEISQSLIWAVASFFIFGKFNSNNKDIEKFTLLFPSQHGFFIGKFSSDPIDLNIITYVNKDSSWPEQNEAFRILNAIPDDRLAFLAADVLARNHIRAEHSDFDDLIFKCWRDYGWRIKEKSDRPSRYKFP